MLKTCKKCNKSMNIKYFHWDKTNENYKSMCKPCYRVFNKKITSKAIKKYSLTNKGKNAIASASKKAYINHKEKWIARAKARYAITKGIIVKPKKCEVCEEVKPLQGHHEDYNKPLEVIFLCYSCHAEADKLLESIIY